MEELVSGVHALALLAATQAHAAALPAGVRTRTLCVTSGGVVYAWCFNLQGQLGVNNTTQQVAQWRERQQLHEISQITVWPDYFVDDRDCSSFAQFYCLQNIATVSCYHLHA